MNRVELMEMVGVNLTGVEVKVLEPEMKLEQYLYEVAKYLLRRDSNFITVKGYKALIHLTEEQSNKVAKEKSREWLKFGRGMVPGERTEKEVLIKLLDYKEK